MFKVCKGKLPTKKACGLRLAATLHSPRRHPQRTLSTGMFQVLAVDLLTEALQALKGGAALT